MASYRMGWLLVAVALTPAVYSACGGDDSNGGSTTGTGGSTGTGGAVTGSGGSTSGSGGTAGAGAPGSGGTPVVVDAGRTDAGRIPCGDAGTCNPAQQNARMCDIANQRCVECLAESDCAGDMGGDIHCNIAQGRCRPCVLGSTDPALGCPAGQTCGGNNGACQVVCTADTQCAALMNTPACNTTTSMCVECVTDAHCAANPANANQPHCDVANNNCVECLANADCAAQAGQPVCRLTGNNANQCVQCLVDADCAGGDAGTTHCRLAGGNANTCAQCLTAADCPIPGSTCPNNGGACRPPVEGGAPEAGRPDATTPVSDAASGG
jgi:hypothetical protein